MGRKIFFLIIFIYYSTLANIYADRTLVKASDDPNPCKTDFDPNSTQITFYGDSLGDWIDFPFGYGYFGWEWYLSVHEPAVKWDIQNLAVGGNTTHEVYELIRKCSASDVTRNNFRTADNVALEIGGNDYMANIAVLYYMPWKFGDVDARVTHNTRVIVRALRNSLRNKKIILMGNFPVIAKSPILGDAGDYFTFWKYLPNGQITDKNKQFEDSRIENQFQEDLGNSLMALLDGFRQIYDQIVNFHAPLHGADLTRILTAEPALNSRTGKDLWYWKHLAEWKKTPSSLMSIGMMFHQLSLMKMADEENTNEYAYEHKATNVVYPTVIYRAGRVKFVSLFGRFSFPPDADANRYYVANPVLFADLIHINHIGYYEWAKHMTPEFKHLGWHTLPAPTVYGGETCRTWNCGKAEKPPYGTAIEEDIIQNPVVVTPSDIDWLLLLCLFTGKCW
ncbi:MAG: SGNH/GDSL hydrolase family protein [Leptospira sp.]|nr:SGNH/GDSL hydrolase family protein [Leptospira sp.]